MDQLRSKWQCKKKRVEKSEGKGWRKKMVKKEKNEGNDSDREKTEEKAKATNRQFRLGT